MPIEEQVEKAKKIEQETGVCYVAIGLQDYKKRISAFEHSHSGKNKQGFFPSLFFLDTANGSNILVEQFMKWYNTNYTGNRPDIIIGNTLTKASVARAINLNCSGVRHGIGNGSGCLTTEMTGIGCPPVTALYYGWKAIRNHELENRDIGNYISSPTLLLDGGIRIPADLTKAIVCGADAVICGGIFKGCKETPGKIIEKDGNKYKVFRGMASKSVLEDYGLWDGTQENLFVEGKEELVPALDKSVVDVVYYFVNGLRSAMSYLGIDTISELRGSLWSGKCLAVMV